MGFAQPFRPTYAQANVGHPCGSAMGSTSLGSRVNCSLLHKLGSMQIRRPDALDEPLLAEGMGLV